MMRDFALLGLPSFLNSALQSAPSWIPFVSNWRQRSAQECQRRALDRYSAGDLDAAEKYYRAAVQWVPDDPQLHSSLGQVYYEQGNLDQAEGSFRKSLRYNYLDSRALKGLGLLLQLQGNFQ
jgi:tetratricopeptide (TPR) repeat protein